MITPEPCLDTLSLMLDCVPVDKQAEICTVHLNHTLFVDKDIEIAKQMIEIIKDKVNDGALNIHHYIVAVDIIELKQRKKEIEATMRIERQHLEVRDAVNMIVEKFMREIK